MKKLDVAIIGAGSAGLTAKREVEKITKNFLVFDDGPLGTTCARVGCMPSKVMIQVANDYHRRHKFESIGIQGSESLRVDGTAVMQHVRKLRDRFSGGVVRSVEKWQDEFLIKERAYFTGPNTLKAGNQEYQADKIIIAAGSRPILPKPWEEFKEFFIDTNSVFELETLPQSLAVVGLGVIGLELGQAFSRLGTKVVGIGLGRSLGGASDPAIQDYIVKTMGEEFELSLDGVERFEKEGQQLRVFSKDKSWLVDKVLIAVGRRSNLDRIEIVNAGVELDAKGYPVFDVNTAKIKGSSIYIAGDVNGDRPLLHEAADEGRIAGYNAVHEEQCFSRRALIGITFTDPNIAFVGKTYKNLVDEKIPFVAGEVSFESQGRALSMLKNKGLLKIYAHKESGLILGAEMMAPSGEHMAHLISWAISWKKTVHEALSLPFYHPVVEEGLRTAIRSAAKQVGDGPSPLETLRCQDDPVSSAT